MASWNTRADRLATGDVLLIYSGRRREPMEARVTRPPLIFRDEGVVRARTTRGMVTLGADQVVDLKHPPHGG